MNGNVVKGAVLVAIGLLAAMTGKKLAERGFGRIKQRFVQRYFICFVFKINRVSLQIGNHRAIQPEMPHTAV